METGSRAIDADRWGDMEYMASKVYVDTMTHDAAVDIYDTWARNYNKLYGEAMVSNEYRGPRTMARAMQDLFPAGRDQAVLLDVGVGTGLCGHLLHELGFRVMDGLDPSAGMLQVAKEKNVYRHLFQLSLTSQPTDIPANTYDAVVLVGVMGHGLLRCEAFEEMARVVKPGGYIVNCFRKAYLQEVPDYINNWQDMVTRMEKEGKWKVFTWETYPNHLMGYDGLLAIFQILS